MGEGRSAFCAGSLFPAYTVFQICPQGPAPSPICQALQMQSRLTRLQPHWHPFGSPERFLPSSGLLLRLASPWNAISPLFPDQLLTFAFCKALASMSPLQRTSLTALSKICRFPGCSSLPVPYLTAVIYLCCLLFVSSPLGSKLHEVRDHLGPSPLPRTWSSINTVK